jgi:hypothetical protein
MKIMTTSRKYPLTRYQIRRWALATAILALAAGARLVLFRKPPQAEAYFQHVVAVANAAPVRFGSWVSTDEPVPPAAITMLRPNLTISRRYTNLQTGQQATLLLVQCSDATSLQGHYPPVCYKAHGFSQVAADPRNLQAQGLDIQATVYTFSSTRPEELSSMVIYDFMILPDGRTCRDMAGVNAAAGDPRNRQLGAAQMQILMNPSLPEKERDAIFLALVEAHRPTIDAILAGEQP